MRRLRSGFALVALIALASCVAPRQAPPPPPAPPPAPPPPAPLPPPPVDDDWHYAPLTPGTWTYRTDADGSTGTFGLAGQQPLLALRCNRAGRALTIAWPLRRTGNDRATITTSYSVRSVAAAQSDGQVWIRLAANDGLLDQMAFSRGRLMIADGVGAALILPAWAEISRVIEDCRT